MTPNETKRCHFVPKTYLEKFRQELNNKKVLFARLKTNKEVFKTDVKSVCVRKNLYILPGETENDRQLIERFYATDIENNYNKIYDILNCSGIVKIKNQERELIISTIITSLFRNPFILDRFNDFWTNTIDRLFSLADSVPSKTFQIDNKSVNVDNVDKHEFIKKNNEQNKHIFNIEQIRLAFRLIEIRINDCISVTEIQDGHEYITSDNPVSISNPNAKLSGSIFDPTNYLRMPINNKKCLVIYPHGTQDFNSKDIYRRKIKSSAALLDSIYINKLQHFYADRILIGSNKALTNVDILVNKSDEEVLSLAIKVKKDFELFAATELKKRMDILNSRIKR